MQVTLELPDNLETLPPEQQTEKVLKALQATHCIKTKKIIQPIDKLSKWAQISKRIENDPIHLDGYSEQLKKDMKEFRDNFEFSHDQS